MLASDSSGKRAQTIRDWRARGYTSSPLSPAAKRAELFSALDTFISGAGGWVISAPGASAVQSEAAPESKIPHDLIAMGFAVSAVGEGSRIIPGGVVSGRSPNKAPAGPTHGLIWSGADQHL